MGRTDTNKTVIFPRGGEQPGEYVDVRITRVNSATLFGARWCRRGCGGGCGMKQSVLVLMLLLMLVPGAGAQKGGTGHPEVCRPDQRRAGGTGTEQLPALLSKYPNHPGVLYLQGLLTKEGAEAVRIYQSIVDNFPKSEWADDAVYKTYQFYYSLGLFRTAELKMNQLKAAISRLRRISRKPPTDTASEGRQRAACDHGAAAGDTAGAEAGSGETRRSGRNRFRCDSRCRSERLRCRQTPKHRKAVLNIWGIRRADQQGQRHPLALYGFCRRLPDL